MGLDIYLYTKERQAFDTARDDAWDKFWERTKDLPEDEQKAEREKANESGELPAYVSLDEGLKSSKHPEHYMNPHYLRSSYNQSGFNRAVPDFTGQPHDFYWIFEPVRGDSDEYDFELTEASLTALDECIERAEQVAQELRECDMLRVDAVGTALVGALDHMWKEPPSEAEVLAWYREEARKRAELTPEQLEKAKDWGEGYSNAKGDVFGFTKGLEVLAVVAGQSVLRMPSAIIVYRAEDSVEYYVQAAEIVVEFCMEAQRLIRRDGGCHITWSG